MKKRLTSVLSLVLVALFALAAYAGTFELTGKNFDLIYATNTPGTGYYTIAAAQGAIATTKTGTVNVTVLPTPGSEGVAAAMQARKAHVGILSPGNMKLLYGDGVGADQNVRALFNGGQTPFSFVVNAKSGIKTVTDLKGKRVAYVSNNSTYIYAAEAIMRGYGLDPKTDIRAIPMTDATAGFQDLVDGRNDAVIATIQGAKMDELGSKIEYHVITFDEEHIGAILDASEEVGYFVKHTIARAYPGADEGSIVIGTLSQVNCVVDAEDEPIYLFVKSVIEGYSELSAVTPDLVSWTPQMAVSANAGFPYHPGAVAYYKDAGMWPDEVEQWQTELLKKLGQDR